jgi:ketosteroid isomerase-like protein
MSVDQTALGLVSAFHQAVNAPDVARLHQLVTPDVEVGGPRGSGRGADLMAEWIARAGVRLTPRRVLARGPVVVVEQEATWKEATWNGAETGAPASSQTVATVFVVRDGRISSVVRHGSLEDALRASGLGPEDERDERDETDEAPGLAG